MSCVPAGRNTIIRRADSGRGLLLRFVQTGSVANKPPESLETDVSGHSKWSSIKHKKGATDAKRGQLFTKLAREITMAARGNPDPKMNASLRLAIQHAKD